MKTVMLYTTLAALLIALFITPVTSDDNGLHNGWVQGCGHVDCGQGKGHDRHGCDAECPLCGGNPCIPPCPGV